MPYFSSSSPHSFTLTKELRNFALRNMNLDK
ncbi:MAG: hypothetical protein ACI837_000962, partial [Crocinitomicaceae bacterium]